MTRRKRQWESVTEDDPGAGLLNLFDLWMAFAIAVLLALVTSTRLAVPTLAEGCAAAAGSSAVQGRQVKVEHLRVTQEKLSGDGERLGTAYRLKSGEVVYVPEQAAPEPGR